MKSNTNRHAYTLRVDALSFEKFRYIAESEGRSVNKAIELYMKRRILAFEREHGPIVRETPVQT